MIDFRLISGQFWLVSHHDWFNSGKFRVISIRFHVKSGRFQLFLADFLSSGYFNVNSG